MADIHTPAAFSPALPTGIMLGNYIILKVIGSGGFGITYLAQEEITDKLVVIKENYPADVSFRDMTSLAVGPAGESRKEAYDWALTRFLNEAKILSRLSHPNIVPIWNAFKALGTAYYVMPHVEGTELQKAAPAADIITAEWLLPVLEKILSALDYLHMQGLIHRDIKPHNIMILKDGLRAMFENLIDEGCHTVGLVTPTHFLPEILPALTPKLPVPVVYNCGGYESVETL